MTWGSKAGFFPVDQAGVSAGQHGELVEPCRIWRQNFS